MRAAKLYVIVRADLPPGDQAVQAMHAARMFAFDHPGEEGEWFRTSNHIALLEAPDLPSLVRLRLRAEERGIAVSRFTEEDLGGEETALAMGPSGRKVCSGLPCALKGKRRDSGVEDRSSPG